MSDGLEYEPKIADVYRPVAKKSSKARALTETRSIARTHASTAVKLLVWDKVRGLRSTDPLAGLAAITANLVVSFYFAKRSFENVARIIRR